MTSRTSPTNNGFTLMEMMLVLAILVVVGAIVLPAARGPMDDLRLRDSGDVIRAQWDRARVKAMKTGCIHVFRYQIGGDQYSLQPWQNDPEAGAATNTAQTAPLAALSASTEDIVPNRPLGIRGVRLPSGITFHTGSSTLDARAAKVSEDPATAQGAAAGGGNWSQPIVFYADGSSTDACVVLTNQRFFVQLQLRGLTGISRGSDLLSESELSTTSSR